MQPATAEDLAHFAAVLEIHKKHWDAVDADVKEKLKTHNASRAPAEMAEEFNATWSAADTDADGKLSKDEFKQYHEYQMKNLEAAVGWRDHYTEEENDMVFDAIQALNPAEAQITKELYLRYAMCIPSITQS